MNSNNYEKELEKTIYIHAAERSFDKAITKKIEELEEKINEIKTKNNGKLSFGDKINLRIYNRDLRDLKKLKASFYNFRYERDNAYKMPEALKEDFNKLAVLLNDADLSKLESLVNNNPNLEQEKRIKEKATKTRKLIKKCGIDAQTISIHDKNNITRYGRRNYGEIVGEVESFKLNKLSMKYIHVKPEDYCDIKLSTTDELMLKNLKEIINNNEMHKFADDKQISDAINNFNKIEESLYAIAKAEKIEFLITTLITKLKQDNDADFNEVIGFLEKIKRDQIEIKEASKKFLEKFNFDYIKSHLNLNSKNKDMPKEANIEGTLKFLASKSLKEVATKQLVEEGILKYDDSMELISESQEPVEFLIAKRVELLVSFVDKTPEERGLLYLKEKRQIGYDAKLADLKPAQIAEFKQTFSDEALGYIGEYKEWRNSARKKFAADNIYKDYWKYCFLARKNGEEKIMTFSEFAQRVHNLDAMDLFAIDEDALEEAKGHGLK